MHTAPHPSVPDASLTLLDTVGVDAPCPADWNAMAPTGDHGIRHCAQCTKDVVNLSALSRAAAAALLHTARTEEQALCIRFARDARGAFMSVAPGETPGQTEGDAGDEQAPEAPSQTEEDVATWTVGGYADEPLEKE